MFDAVRKWRKKHSCDFSFREELARQSQQTMDSMLETYRACQNRTSEEMQAATRESFKKIRQSENARRCQEIIADLDSKGIDYRIEYLYNGNGDTKMFVVPLGIKRDIKPSNENKNRCKYCGCLVSSFDTHCKSCGAPI